MNRIKYSIVIIALAIMHPGAIAQVLLPDGVSATPSFIDTIIKNYNKEDSLAFDLNNITLSVKIPIRIHVIKDIKGKSGVSNTDIINSISTANNYFKNIGIQFFVDSMNYINDYNYSYIAYNHNRKELLTMYAASRMINLFLADSIELGNTRSYGFTYFPDTPDSNFIFLDKKFITGKYLTTMLGHFMGLLSTHETTGGAELVSEKNCAKSGDFICDTYADPDLLNQVDSTCNYTGSLKDSSNKYYIPSVANIMSNSLDNCKCIFTPLQYRRMYYYYLKYRQYLGY